MSREEKQERSIPVQSRVDIKSLTEMDMYWKSIGVDIKSMSQLVSWTVDMCHEILLSNGKLPVIVKEVAECHRYMKKRDLYQRGLKGRTISKISAAMRFENLRLEGADPRVADKKDYNIVHNSGSINPYGGEGIVKGRRDWDEASDLTEEQKKRFREADELYETEKNKGIDDNVERQKVAAMNSGHFIRVSGDEDLEEKHRRTALENDEKIKEMDMMPLGPSIEVEED